MFNVIVPSYEFESLDVGLEALNKHQWDNRQATLASLKVNAQDGTLLVNGSWIPMTNMFSRPMLRSVGLPVNNLSCGLSADRIAGDFNELTDKSSPDTSVVVRTMDGAAYDLKVLTPKQSDSGELGMPINHSVFLGNLVKNVPHLRHHHIEFFQFKDGTLHLRTRSEDQKLEPRPGDISWSGLEYINTDYANPYTAMSYHLYRTSCSNSAVGIAERVWSPGKNASTMLGDIIEVTETYLQNQDTLKSGYQMLSDTPLTMYALKGAWTSLLRVVGKKSTEQILSDYLRDGDEEGWKEPDPSVLSLGKTDYDLFNDITFYSKNLDKTSHRWGAQQVAGGMVTKYMDLTRKENAEV